MTQNVGTPRYSAPELLRRSATTRRSTCGASAACWRCVCHRCARTRPARLATLARDLCAHNLPSARRRARQYARTRARTWHPGAVDAHRDLRSRGGAIERTTRCRSDCSTSSQRTPAAVAAVGPSSPPSSMAARRHSTSGSRRTRWRRRSRPHASGDVQPPGAAAHDERRTTAFDALANAAEEEDGL